MKNKREDFTIICDSECFVSVSLSKDVQNILFQSISPPKNSVSYMDENIVRASFDFLWKTETIPNYFQHHMNGMQSS